MTLMSLSSVARIDSGAGFPIADQGLQGEEFPFLKVSDMNLPGNERQIVRWNNSVSEPVRKKLRAKAFPAGTVIFPKIGAAIGTNKKRQLTRPSCVDNNVMVVVPQTEVLDADYLYFAFRAKNISDFASASNPPSIRKPDVESWQVRVPSLSEQRRIVDLLTRAEGIVRLRREAAAKAAELIPALFIHHFGDPATNPMGWPQCTLGEVVNIASGGTPSKARSDFWEGDLPWVSPKDMKRTVIVDAIDHVSPKVVEETKLKLVPRDAVLIVVRGMILAHTVPVAITARPVTINQDMKALTAKEGVMPAFLLWHLKVMHHELLGATSTAAHGTKKLETKDLLRQPVVVPPLSLQNQFCGQLVAMESIQRQQTEALAKAQSTFDALLARAFAPA